VAASAIQLTPSIIMFAIKSVVVTGASCSPKTPENFLLKAAREKRRFVPHSWHLVALMPTNAPQAGQIWGRGWLLPPPPKNARIVLFQRSSRRCHS
jgi:hypothetical protein